jgi:hypothetical protein
VEEQEGQVVGALLPHSAAAVSSVRLSPARLPSSTPFEVGLDPPDAGLQELQALMRPCADHVRARTAASNKLGALPEAQCPAQLLIRLHSAPTAPVAIPAATLAIPVRAQVAAANPAWDHRRARRRADNYPSRPTVAQTSPWSQGGQAFLRNWRLATSRR